ncbi:MAG: Transcriptional regulator, MarR family [uncultured Sulfurovum sp.]|uniref:Transcriptional regulator, MarR family n=1 Tax=uncultured Sulfurovum sp. TaxID=269237 RepID=A0A6S6SCK1_9BACT|nr:MAG: Transcriptional regulator, MarR family [uncultured Sulfurovum sp.]
MKKEHLDNFYNNIAKDEKEVFGLSLPIMLIQKHLFNKGAILIQNKFNLLNSEMDVLVSLFFNGKILSPTDLYEATILSSGGMTKILKKLQEKGYIERIPSSKDKRSLLVQITQEGERITEAGLMLFLKKDTEVFGILEKEEQRMLFKLLKKVVYSVVEMKSLG